MNSRATPARDRLLQAAAELFYADGMAATGIDAIIARAGVAKMSLYNNFESKDALTAAYLDARHEEWLALYRARLAQASGPTAAVLAVFDAYLDHAEAFVAAGCSTPPRSCRSAPRGGRRCANTRRRSRGSWPHICASSPTPTRRPAPPSICRSCLRGR